MSNLVQELSFGLIMLLSFYMLWCDIKAMRIPILSQVTFFVLVISYQIYFFDEYKLNILIAFLVFLVLMKGNLGGADKKLIPLQGLLLSFESAIAYYFFLSISYFIHHYRKRKRKIKKALPFYPIIVLASFLSLLLMYFI